MYCNMQAETEIGGQQDFKTHNKASKWSCVSNSCYSCHNINNNFNIEKFRIFTFFKCKNKTYLD